MDGSIDVVRGADYVTVSWNHFDHTDKTMLISHSDGASSTDVGHLKGDHPSQLLQQQPAAVAGSVAEARAYYPYTMDSAANVPGLVRAGAGAGRI